VEVPVGAWAALVVGGEVVRVVLVVKGMEVEVGWG
jgi:hypothetical protein